jgi:hypothetical protein
MAKYMLLLYDCPASWKDISPDEMQKAIQKYIAWGERLHNQGVFEASHKLAADVGKVIRGHGKQLRVIDGPYSETKEILGGYFLIDAPNYNDAVKQCNDCPHLEYGGTIEVREVDTMMGSPTDQP